MQNLKSQRGHLLINNLLTIKYKMHMNKIAITHIEIVLSFLIFLGFVIFLFVILSPFKDRTNKNLVDFVYGGVYNKMKTDLSSISISFAVAPAGCFSFGSSDLISNLNCIEHHVIVKDENNVQVNAKLEGNDFQIANSGKFYTIYCSDELIGTNGINGCSSETPVLGVVRTKEVLAVSRINNFVSEYNSDYDALKRDINMPENSDFGFVINDLDGAPMFEGKKQRPTGVDVIVKTFPVEILYSDARIQNAVLKVIVW